MKTTAAYLALLCSVSIMSVAIAMESPQPFSLQTPDHKRTLIVDLSLEINPSEGVSIIGASGGGKSSLLRALAGLWDAGSGTIMRPPLKEMFFYRSDRT